MEHGSLITFKPDGTPVRVADMDLAAIVQKMLGIIKIEFLPYRPDELPDFYYFCNGDRYPTDSPQGERLLSTSANFKLDWGITVVDDTINVPNMFYTDGRGFFVRAVDGTTKQVGSIENDTIKSHRLIVRGSSPEASSAMPVATLTYSGVKGFVGVNHQNSTMVETDTIPFDGTAFVRYDGGTETVPLYVGMTPAIRLGV